MRQKTIKKDISCSGIGLHEGKKVNLTLKPAPENTGIVFWLKKGRERVSLDLNPYYVSDTLLATTLSKDNKQVATVEHLLGAIQGLEIDNLYIEVEGEELPIMDGSATSFVFLMRSVGLKKQNAPKKVLGITKPLKIENGNKKIEARPYKGLKIHYEIDFSHPLIGRQTYTYINSPERFVTEIAKARTFGFLKDVEMLQQAGKAKGGSLENALVLDEYGLINTDGLRFKDEFVRHKILDFLGDILLIGMPLWGEFKVSCSGHAFNNHFVRFLLENKDHYLTEITLSEEKHLTPKRKPVFEAEPEVVLNM